MRSQFPEDGVIEVSDPDFFIVMNDLPASEVARLPQHPLIDSVPPVCSFRGEIDDLVLYEARMDLLEHSEVLNVPADEYDIARLGSCDLGDASWSIRFSESLSCGDEVHLQISDAYRRELDLSTNDLIVIVETGD